MLKIGLTASRVILAEYWCTCSHFPCLLHNHRKGENNRWRQRWESEEMDCPLLSCGDGENKSIAWPDSPLTECTILFVLLPERRPLHLLRWMSKNVWMSFDCTVFATGFRNGSHHLGIRIDSVIQHISSGTYTIDLPLLWCGGWNWFWQGPYKTTLPLHEQIPILKLDLLILDYLNLSHS